MDLFTDLQRRLHLADNMLRQPLSSAAKERRQFETLSLLDPLACYADVFAPVRQPHGKPVTIASLAKEVDILWRKTWSESLRLGADRVIRVKPSASTRTLDGSATVLRAITKTVRRLTRPGVAASLPSFLQTDSPGVYEEISDGKMSDNPYFRDLLAILRTSAPSLGVLRSFRERWPVSAPPSLKIRPYPARQEVRAYGCDPNTTRSLLGASLHSLLHPKSIVKRDKMPYASVWTSRGKNLIMEECKVPMGYGVATAFGDISSFTTSNFNIWVALYNAAQYLETMGPEDSRNQPVLLLVENQCIEALPLDILKAFLRVAPFVKVYDSYHEDFYVPWGGLLGVAGVNTIACINFALVLRYLTNALSVGSITIQAKQGGDDYRVRMIGQPEAMVAPLMIIGDLIEKVVGHQKEYVVSDIQNVAGIPVQCEVARFCKKPILVTTQEACEETTVTFRSEFRLPLLSCLLRPRLADPLKERQEFIEFASQLGRVIPWDDDQAYWIEMYLALWERLRGPQSGAGVGPVVWVPPVHLRGLGTSPECEAAIGAVRPVLGPSGILYLTTRATRLLLFFGLSRATQLRLDGFPAILVLNREKKLFSRVRPEDNHRPKRAINQNHLDLLVTAFRGVGDAFKAFNSA